MLVLLLLDLPFQLLVFSPILLWVLGPDWLHPWIIGVTAAVVLAVAVPLVRRARRRYLAVQAAAPPEDGWRWPGGMPPAMFLSRCSLFLRMHGWRIEEARVSEAGDVEILAQKDRARALLHCLKPGSTPEEAQLAALATASARLAATRAALVCVGRPPAPLLSKAAQRRLLLLRNADLPQREPLLAEP